MSRFCVPFVAVRKLGFDLLAALVPLFFLCGVSLAAQYGELAPLKGRLSAFVTSVDDGDTIAVMVGSDRHKIRLSDIDAPEVTHCVRKSEAECRQKGQRWGEESGRQLAGLVLQKTVFLSCSDYDSRYSRSVCRVYLGDFDVNLYQVKTGMAWHNKKYSSDRRAADAERAAQLARTGIWSDSRPVEPWVWRDLCWKRGVC